MSKTGNDRPTSKTGENTKPQGKTKGSKFQKLFTEELKDIYWAEKHLVSALPKMAKGATTGELKMAIENHLEETKVHVERLEEVFSMLEMKPRAKTCEAMEGLIEEGKTILEDTEEDSMVRDAGIIIASQKIEHYEIASYGSLVALARKMGRNEAAELLEMTLEEEKGADEKLTMIAVDHINEEASEE